MTLACRSKTRATISVSGRSEGDVSGRVFDLPKASQQRSAATRARFVAAATKLLAERTWDDISIEDLVAEADLSVGAFYKRFRAKDDVLAACVEDALEEGRSRAAALMAVQGPLETRVAALVDALAEGWDVRAHVVRAAKAMAHDEHVEALRRESAATQARLAAWLLECRDEFGRNDAEAAVSAAFALPLSALQTACAAPICADQKALLRREATAMIYAFFKAPR